MSITKPSADYIQRVAKFLPVHSKAIKHFEEQVYIERKDMNINQITSLTTEREAEKKQANVECQEKSLPAHSSTTPLIISYTYSQLKD